MIYRRDDGEALGHSFRSVYFDRRVDTGLTGSLLGPRLGSYSLLGGLEFLRANGRDRARDQTRRRFESRVSLLPQSPVALTSSYSSVWSKARPDAIENIRSEAWAAGVVTHLMPRSSSSFDLDRRRNDAVGYSSSARTYRAHHSQTVTIGTGSLDLNYDFTDLRLETEPSSTTYDTRHHVGQADSRWTLKRLGELRGRFQIDRERSHGIAGLVPERTLDKDGGQLRLETRLGLRATLQQSYSDEAYRSRASGQSTGLRFQTAEERLDGRYAAGRNSDMHAMLRGRYDRVSRQPDLLLVTALGELEARKPAPFTVTPQLGFNFYSGGVMDGMHLGEILGLTASLRMGRHVLELSGARERTKGNGLSGRFESGAARGYSPREIGTQLVHSARFGYTTYAEAFSLRGEYGFQRVENTDRGISYLTHRLRTSASYRFSQRLTFDLSVEGSSADNRGIYFTNEYRNVVGTLAVLMRPSRVLEIRSQGSYGRIPTGARESYWSFDNTAAYHFPQLELSLHHTYVERVPTAETFDGRRSERLLEFRATRNFWGVL